VGFRGAVCYRSGNFVMLGNHDDKALGLDVPDRLLALADEVIE
jgi:hypothetical protein